MALDVKEINEAYFNASNFASMMHGIYFAVFLVGLSKIFTGPKRAGQSRIVMAVVVITLFIGASIDHARYWAYVRVAFVKNGQTAESIANSLNSYPIWYTSMICISDANAILADTVIIWRCWVIWGRSWRMIIIPIMCTMMTTAFSIIALYQLIAVTTFGVLKADYATALYSTTLATTVYCTAAIVYRIVTISSRSTGEVGFRSYKGVIEIIVESSLLYSVATMFALIANIYSGPAAEYAAGFWSSSIGIAPTLLVARAASGSARSNQTWNEASTKQVPGWSLIKFGAHRSRINGSATEVGGTGRYELKASLHAAEHTIINPSVKDVTV